MRDAGATMQTQDEFTSYYSSMLDGSYDCIDRIVINAYFSMGQTPGGFRKWWIDLHGTDDNLDTNHLMRFAGRFSRRVRAWARQNGIPLIDCGRGERKHEQAHEYIPRDPNFAGVFLVQVSKFPAVAWKVKRNKGCVFISRANPRPYVNHYSFHIIDPQWGHVTIMMCGHPPFGAMIILNGHEWVEREARRRGVDFSKQDNCFVGGSDYGMLSAVADSLVSDDAMGRLHYACNRWIYSACLCFAIEIDEQKRSGFVYSYSAYQLEYSRNLKFTKGAQMDEVYQAMIDRTRNSLDIKTLTKIFGHKHRPFYRLSDGKKVECQARIEKPSYDLTVFKINFGRLGLKIYDKGENVLRIEATSHHVKDLKCGKVLSNIVAMCLALKEMVVRFLNVLKCAHISFIDDGTFDSLHLPSLRGNTRLAGIDVNQPRMRNALAAVVALAPKPGGFTISDIASKIQEMNGWSDEQYGKRQAAYDLKKLRGKNLVEKPERSRKYITVQNGIRVICALLVLREKVIKPLLASAAKPRLANRPNDCSPIDAHYDNIAREMNLTFATLGIAA